MSNEIFVTVARTLAPAIQVCLNGEHTVLDACRAASIQPKESEGFKVNGSQVDEDYELEDGDRLVITQHIEGGRN